MRKIELIVLEDGTIEINQYELIDTEWIKTQIDSEMVVKNLGIYTTQYKRSRLSKEN